MISLDELTAIVDKFESDHKSDCERVYKSCSWAHIVVMEKLHDTQTNESRADVVNKNTAKFQADKLKVLLIISLKDGSTDATDIVNMFSDRYGSYTTHYIVGSIVKPNSYDNRINVVCTNGIHYFRSLEAAYFYNMPSMRIQNGMYKQWYDNGGLSIQCNVVDGNWYVLHEIWTKNDKSNYLFIVGSILI